MRYLTQKKEGKTHFAEKRKKENYINFSVNSYFYIIKSINSPKPVAVKANEIIPNR